MNERAEMIKTAIQLELAKEGKTLQDLEASLQKSGAASLTNLGSWWDIIKSLGGVGLASGLALGAAGGTGVYAAHLANEDTTNQHLKKLKARQQYMEAEQSLKERMQNPTIM